ncbi:DUF3224 domain-containing protein [Saccharomonospora sp. NPDC046836]|uniref:DUF3224 domain-containing protein n=1 Tax=Saccharomonospora sp. NPDC046836 TaxID=3156921 RepID=UPI0033F29901
MTGNTFTTQTWDEHVVNGPDDGPRYAHVHATFAYTGILEGTSSCDYLIYYATEGYDDGNSQLAPGLERIEGSVDGHKGSFVARHDVRYGPDGITDNWTVVPGSGTGELAGLSGHGTAAGNSTTIAYTFDYDLS